MVRIIQIRKPRGTSRVPEDRGDWLNKPSINIVLNKRCGKSCKWPNGELGRSYGLRQSLCLHEAKRPPISIKGPPRLTCCTLSSHLSPASSMSSESHLRSKRRDCVLAGLAAAIPILTAAKDVCGFPPAQIALGSACALLTIIKVHSILFFDNQLLIHLDSEHHGQQTGLSRSRTVLR